jgi:methyl-accepting chemotaxis protein
MQRFLQIFSTSFKVKLIGAFLAISILPLAVIGYSSFVKSKDALIKTTCGAIGGRAFVLMNEIDRILFERYGDVQAFAFNPMAKGTPEEITEAVNYYVTTYATYDLMVVTDAEGKVLAANTVTFDGKPLDTKTLIGRSVRGEAWFEEVASGKVRPGESYSSDLVEDKLVAEFYHNRGLTLTFSAPILDAEGKLVGVWSNFTNWDRSAGDVLNYVREAFKGQGKELEMQVIARNGVLLDDPDPAAILKVNLADLGLEAAKKITQGESGSIVEMHKRRKVEQINGFAVSKGHGSYRGHGWGIILREDMDKASAAATALGRFTLLVGAIASAIIAVLAYWYGGRVCRQIQNVIAALNRITSGDFLHKLQVASKDEFGTLASSVNEMSDQLGAAHKTNADHAAKEKQKAEEMTALLKQINENAATLGSSAEELTAVSTQMAANAEETSAQANVVSAASEQVSRNVQTVTTGVEEMNSAIREIAKNATESAHIAQQAVATADIANKSISKLGESSIEIGNVIKVITSIAEQTNLLALNATIEAARAGEAGKGFAVVANEVKELAKDTARATEDISRKIETIQADTNGAIESIQQISQVIAQINDISTTIAGAVEEQTATANEMGRNVNEAAKGTAEIAQNITAVAQAAQNTTQGASNSQQAASELARMASDLQKLGSQEGSQHTLAV